MPCRGDPPSLSGLCGTPERAWGLAPSRTFSPAADALPESRGASSSDALCFGLAQFHEFLRPFELQRKPVHAESVPPAAQGLEKPPAPAGEPDVLNGRPARIDDPLEVIDPALDPAGQPWDLRIGTDGEIVPAFSRPFLRRC